eukprot:CAMPEP_0194220450 /NCGR_PEP_ID=MMETSP0156-20130528/28394_1 /TAXON_ID=33649 /ORGANISM="Thalassionema nitzschioides, Strain L26-B" /LENGTH=583 /DNA_ID=CAMNT_0038950491 /DNA_START=436 /DNA_END=2187 /DNA_ORIENTATION=-
MIMYQSTDVDDKPLESPPKQLPLHHPLQTEDVESDASISLDTTTSHEETITNLDLLPPHIHPHSRPEIVHPQFKSTTPALKLWPLAILIFYNVSGGPFGIEASIRAGGNFYAIVGFLVFPLVWSVPEALVTAELGSTFRDASGGVAWVEEAFGENAGFMCGYLGWIAGATDNAIYPTLFLEYVTSVAGWDKDEFIGWSRFAFIGGITLFLAGLNYTGLEIVGKCSLLVCIIAMSPFVVITILAVPKVVPSRWFQMPEASDTEFFDDDFQTSPGPLPLLGLAHIVWRPYLNNLFWNLNSFDSAASFAAETSCVRTIYPRSIFIGLVMCILLYIIPLMVAVGATDYKQEEWVDGHFGAVAVDLGGNLLGGWMVFAAGISNLALFEAEMSADAFQLMGMAERGYLPKIFQKRSKFGTPTMGIIVGTLVILAFGCADFGQLLELLNVNYAISLLMEYAAFIKLRLFHKQLQRPYRIPIPDWAAVLIAIPPSAGILLIFAISNWAVYIFTLGALAFGVILFKFGETSKQRGWFNYELKLRSSLYEMALAVDDVTEPEEHSYDNVAGDEVVNECKVEDLDDIKEENRVV